MVADQVVVLNVKIYVHIEKHESKYHDKPGGKFPWTKLPT